MVLSDLQRKFFFSLSLIAYFFVKSERQRELMGKGRVLRLTKMSTLESPSQGFLSTSKAILKIVSEPTDNSAKDYALAVRWVHWYSGKRY